MNSQSIKFTIHTRLLSHIQVYLIMPDAKDKLENGVYVLKSVARPWLALQIGEVVDPETKARKG